MKTFKRSCRRCGWSNTYRTAGYADYGKRSHSCDRQIMLAKEKAEREVRIAQREAARDRTPKPCLHKVAQHVHGTHSCYVSDHCHCPPCSAANRVYEAHRNRMNAYGRGNYVDATSARDHVLELGAQGMGWKRVAEAAGVSSGGMWKLLYGKRRPDGTCIPSKRVTRATEAKILAVELDLADGARVDPTGTRRRLQGLVALGYSQSFLASRLGMDQQNFTRTMHHADRVLKSTADGAAAIYDELSMTPNRPAEWRQRIAASRARNIASEHGWVPPLMWDDDIDDPSAVPAGHTIEWDEADLDDAAIDRRIAGDRTVTLSRDERIELVRRWDASGRPRSDCERITGIPFSRYWREVAAA